VAGHPGPDVEQILQTKVSLGEAGAKPFGQLTAQDVGAHGDRLSDAAGWGTEKRVQPLANAWRTLAEGIERDGVAAVADHDPEMVAKQAEKLWIVPPGGSLL
jgi:hypothetical protein